MEYNNPSIQYARRILHRLGMDYKSIDGKLLTKKEADQAEINRLHEEFFGATPSLYSKNAGKEEELWGSR